MKTNWIVLTLLITAPASAANWSAYECELLEGATQDQITAEHERIVARGQMPEFLTLTHLSKFNLTIKDERVFRGSLHTTHQGGPHFARQRHQVAPSTAFTFSSSAVSGSRVQATLENLDTHRDRYVYDVRLDTDKATASVAETYHYNESGERGRATGQYKCKKIRVVIGNQDVGTP